MTDNDMKDLPKDPGHQSPQKGTLCMTKRNMNIDYTDPRVPEMARPFNRRRVSQAGGYWGRRERTQSKFEDILWPPSHDCSCIMQGPALGQ